MTMDWEMTREEVTGVSPHLGNGPLPFSLVQVQYTAIMATLYVSHYIILLCSVIALCSHLCSFITPYTDYNIDYRPTSRRSRPAAVEGPGSGQLPTASSTSSKKVVLL